VKRIEKSSPGWMFSTTSRTSPTEKGGSMCREGGGKRGHRVSSH
jgi:hypothetical protein